MSAKVTAVTKTIIAVITISLAILASVKAWFILPYRVDQLEQRALSSAITATADHELLIRIDERNQRMQEQLNRIERSVEKK